MANDFEGAIQRPGQPSWGMNRMMDPNEPVPIPQFPIGRRSQKAGYIADANLQKQASNFFHSVLPLRQ